MYDHNELASSLLQSLDHSFRKILNKDLRDKELFFRTYVITHLFAFYWINDNSLISLLLKEFSKNNIILKDSYKKIEKEYLYLLLSSQFNELKKELDVLIKQEGQKKQAALQSLLTQIGVEDSIPEKISKKIIYSLEALELPQDHGYYLQTETLKAAIF
ncbi:hypothetical protein DBT_1768 [Dissulfuribacter thermophilus]|uniref:Uncharacterized protein n=1 Tax=Dissulfuribacter thermophilus TaxID=1156395 RepID=A0A1B9F449_9BACT|nr:hypothetical protein [Dissulfuribacter thermophilus]OCC14708.1 hypothetical protein DBT_1768 [Dissulfuribacter thermophilus]